MKRILAGWMDYSQLMNAKDEGYRGFTQKNLRFDISVVVSTGMKQRALCTNASDYLYYLPASQSRTLPLFAICLLV